MENLKNYLVVGVISFVLGGAVIKYYWPTPVNTDKKQTVETEVTKNNITTVTTEEVDPTTGKKKTVTTVVDKSEKKESTKSTESKTTVAKADLFFGGGYVKNIKDSQEKDDYQVLVGKRLAGPVLGFVTYQFKGVVTANVVIEF
jgi:ABC-type phosphate transport system auxiliary subunit